MNATKFIKVADAAITQFIKYVPIIPPESNNHPDMLFDSIGATIIGTDLSKITTAYFTYFTPDSNGNPVEIVFPLAGVYRSTPLMEMITFTHPLNCYSLKDTVVSFVVEWFENATTPINAQVDLVCTYQD